MLTLSKVPGNCGLVTLSGNDSDTFTREDIRALVRNYEITNNNYNGIRKVMAFTNTVRGNKELRKAGFSFSDFYQGNSDRVTVMLWDRNKNMKDVVPFRKKLKTYLTKLINKL